MQMCKQVRGSPGKAILCFRTVYNVLPDGSLLGLQNPAGHITPQAAPTEPWCYTDKVGAPHGQHGCCLVKSTGIVAGLPTAVTKQISNREGHSWTPRSVPMTSMQATTTNSPSTRFHVVGRGLSRS
ncbi:hypothetical protein BV898_13362 [Hypsibius exemplaris]|uniref:Uncharacterized protein n=1 Tax=Hypsibius exemplaris TaxID=2072580 RepID=A0A1W0WB37_HYPEX|nr:hypothetical protein BV898_13362 [Hypsibius exemplaris]